MKPEFVGLLVEAVSYLDAHAADFDFQLGSQKNFGAEIADAWVLNLLYTEREIRRVFNRSCDPT